MMEVAAAFDSGCLTGRCSRMPESGFWWAMWRQSSGHLKRVVPEGGLGGLK